MNQTQKEAWIALKKAVDKYSQTTGAEVAVVTKFYPIAALSEHYLPQGNIKAELSFHGHGTLSNQVKNAFNPKGDNWSKSKGGGSFGQIFRNNSSQHKSNHSLSSSYHTFKLDQEPLKESEQIHTNSSSNNSNDPLSPSIPQVNIGKKEAKENCDGDLELDEYLLFGEVDETRENGEDDDSSDDDSSVERQQNDNASRFRDNQGPRPPTYNQPISAAQSNAKVIQAEQSTHLDTIMASMQALARSVTDDTSLIFGERPRPRFHKESSTTRHAQ